MSGDAYQALAEAIAQAGQVRPDLVEMIEVADRERASLENSMIAASAAYGAPYDGTYARRVAVLMAVVRTLEAFKDSEGEIRAVLRRAANKRAAA